MTSTELEGRSGTPAETELLVRLRAGDERAFEALVARHYATMLAVAQMYVKGRATAEEVVQEAWLGVIAGLDRFEERSSLKTWILSILVNQAKTRGAREARSVPFAALAPEDDVPAVEDRETLRVVMHAIAGLPPAQQTVIRMRDVEGYSAEEVCTALEVSAANQRVLLHRARSRVRSALEEHLDD